MRSPWSYNQILDSTSLGFEQMSLEGASMAKTGRPAVDPFLRFYSYVSRRPMRYDTDCWIWTGNTPQGRPIFSPGRKITNGKARVYAHKWMWEQENGPVPAGKLLHHLCEQYLCVNPAHLKPLTPTEHQALHHKEERESRTHCSRNHALKGKNLYVWIDPAGRPHKKCRQCRAEAAARFRDRHGEKVPIVVI